MRVCVQGLWHLGSVTAACLAAAGHDVAGLDFDAATISGLRLGNPPIFEPGLADLLQEGLASGRLRFSAEPGDALAGAELLWVTYDTPVNERDEADVDFVMAQVEAALPAVPDGATVLVSSQLPVGSVRRLARRAGEIAPGRSIGFACSPENLRLGKALEVFRHPDRIVVGVSSPSDRDRVERLLSPITRKIEWMTVESAEMTKHAINAFLATSVVFANEIASLCERVGADAKEVERGLKSESRIGPWAYLSPGGAFAGGTLARDVEFLKGIGAASGSPTRLLQAITESNDSHKKWAKRTAERLLGRMDGRTVAVWGLTYKAGTSTLRRSLAVELCDSLLAQGVRLKVHDPAAEILPESWAGLVERVQEPHEALAGADALVVATEWPEYRLLPVSVLQGLPSGFVVLDANRFLAHWREVPGIRYAAVGTPSRPQAVP